MFHNVQGKDAAKVNKINKNPCCVELTFLQVELLVRILENSANKKSAKQKLVEVYTFLYSSGCIEVPQNNQQMKSLKVLGS